MRTRVQRSAGPARSTWLLALLAPALILGIVAMHSLLGQATTTDHTDMTMVATATSPADPTSAPDDGGHGHEGQMPDCGGLMAVCLALLVAVGAYVALRRHALRRVLWRRPPPTLVRLGAVRAAFEQLTPLQRTAVIRC